jgi:hypothetical protein
VGAFSDKGLRPILGAHGPNIPAADGLPRGGDRARARRLIRRLGWLERDRTAGAHPGITAGAADSHAISSTVLAATRTVSVTGRATDRRAACAYTSTDCCGTIDECADSDALNGGTSSSAARTAPGTAGRGAIST